MRVFNTHAFVALVAMGSAMFSISAQADISELAGLIKSPVGRFLMFETEQGAALAVHAMGGDAELPTVDQLIARLGADEMAETAHELQSRLRTGHERFQALLALEGGAEADMILEKIAAEGLTTHLGAQGKIEFIAEDHANYKKESEAFLAEERPGKFAGKDLSSRVFDAGSKLVNVDLRFADLSNAELLFSSFNGASMERADLSEAQMQGANFSSADMRASVLRGGKFRDAVFRKTNLSGADLRQANLINADLRGANLRGADLRDAALGQVGFQKTPGARLQGAIVDAKTQLPDGLTLEWAKSQGAIVVGG